VTIAIAAAREVIAKQMTAAESRELLAAYDSGLTGYTYLE